MYKFVKIEILFVVAIVFIWPSMASAQYVNDTAFCRNVVNRQCIGAIPNGATVSISALPTINGHKAIFFWGSLKNPSENVIAFYFAREGDCYGNDPITPDDRALRTIGVVEDIGGFLSSVTFREAWHALGWSSFEIGAKDIKLNAVLIPEANRYRVFDYRYVDCPGKFSARLINSDGEPIPGKNKVDIILAR